MTATLLIGLLLRAYNILSFHVFESDEAVYAQTMFAVAKGSMPYRDVFFAHPPVYLLFGTVVMCLDPSLLIWRLSNSILGLATAVLLYFLYRDLFGRKAAVLPSIIYALYPLVVSTNKLGLVENLQILFIVMMFLVFSRNKSKSRLLGMFLPGFLGGLALMTKYSSIYPVGSLLVFMLYKRTERKSLFAFGTGAALSIACLIVPILLLGIWSDFYTETVGWQVVRFSMTPVEKISSILVFLTAVFPLLAIAAPTIVDPKEDGDKLVLLWFTLPIAGIVLGQVIFLQHFLIVLPPCCLLAARSVQRFLADSQALRELAVWKRMRLPQINRTRIVKFLATLPIWLVLAVSCASVIGGYRQGSDPLFVSSQFGSEAATHAMSSDILAASFIDNITGPSDRIWTSDAEIAFLSQRVIIVPNVRYWRFQGFFEDIWGYTGTLYRGPIQGYPSGLVSLAQISDAIQTDIPRVIVIKGTSYADYYIWHGISNKDTQETGLSTLIQTSYHLGLELNGTGPTFDSADLEVWVHN